MSEQGISTGSPRAICRVFISYSHDSIEHARRVLALAERLRDDGVDAQLDQYVAGTPSRGWPRWMEDQLDSAQFVLVVCTETYHRRFQGREEPNKGKGVDWEGSSITLELYGARSDTSKFVPVFFEPQDEPFIPRQLSGHTHYLLNSEDNYAKLYAFLTGQAGVVPRKLGPLKTLAREPVAPLTFVADLRFITIPGECRCSVGTVVQKEGEDQFTEIHACWYVTNASEPRMPVQLLKARILEPPIRSASTFCQLNMERPVRARRGDVDSPEREKIHPGETRKMSIHFIQDLQIVDIHLWPRGKPLRVVFAVTDQFAKEHRMPPLLFRLCPGIIDKDVAEAPTAE